MKHENVKVFQVDNIKVEVAGVSYKGRIYPILELDENLIPSSLLVIDEKHVINVEKTYDQIMQDFHYNDEMACTTRLAETTLMTDADKTLLISMEGCEESGEVLRAYTIKIDNYYK